MSAYSEPWRMVRVGHLGCLIACVSNHRVELAALDPQVTAGRCLPLLTLVELAHGSRANPSCPGCLLELRNQTRRGQQPRAANGQAISLCLMMARQKMGLWCICYTSPSLAQSRKQIEILCQPDCKYSIMLTLLLLCCQYARKA